MSLGVGIVIGLVYVLTVVGFLVLFDRMRKLDAQQQDLLLERIQRPTVRPFALDDLPDEEVESRTDLEEMAAVGMIDPMGLSRNDG